MHMSAGMSFNTYKIAELCDPFPVKKMKKRENGFKTTKIYLKAPCFY